ncbi:efflux RND transporter periplasmic adaptor subunit [Ideonella livida]|uniref:Efflux RND transporter periplasmic adaptor subunit n=1 Tax=Ideonella livida TaxID=2707176 RepID=A0A7C9PGN4_9BURK|nr:efflux RND transporter periplasmic adaptor subunit [Ideonella livida]NDY91051.1 efflux RND transporter periplasmic adaptor subunit [Ideonella livida]
MPPTRHRPHPHPLQRGLLRPLRLGLLPLLAGLASLGACQKTEPAAGAAATAAPAASAPRPAQTVTLHTVRTRDVAVEFTALGTLAAASTVEVRPQISSTVRRIAVQEGQAVRAGALLFQLDDRVEQANLDKARATLQRDRVALADLQRQHERAQELRRQHFIAQAAADTVQTQVEAQRALVAQDEAALQAAEVALSLTRLTAPQAGRAGLIAVNPGSVVQPGGAALVTLAQLDPLQVVFTLPEVQWNQLLTEAGGPQGLQRLPLQVMVGAPPPGARGTGAGATPLPGRLLAVDNSVDSSTGTLRLKGELANPGQRLWPGQYVTVRLKVRTLADTPVVPQAALILRGQERQVYVVDAQGVAQLRKVRVRAPQGEWVAVEGVEAGEKVVVEGKQNLRPGTPVREAAGKSGGGATAAAAARPASAGATP